MDKKFLHDLDYIYWKKEANIKYLLRDEFAIKKEEAENNLKIASSKTKRLDFLDNTYYFEKKGYMSILYTRQHNKYYMYYSHIDDEKNKLYQQGIFHFDGSDSKKVVSEMFKEINGCTELKAFGYCNREQIQKCIPTPLSYINDYYNLKELHHVSKVDYSSNYPSNLIGRLPTWKDHKEIKGTVKPTEEYPFAFYINSGHSAEYNVYDTHEWIYNYLVTRLYPSKSKANIILNPDEDITILCKASDYNFNEVVNKLYDMKEHKHVITFDDGYSLPAKKVLNSFIGMMHRKDIENSSYRLDHVAAVVIARASQKMINNYNYLTSLGIDVLQIIVDGIIYKSDYKIGVEVSEKKLGALVQEITDADFIMRGTNAYMFFKDNKFIEEKHGSYNTDIRTDSLQSIKDWRKTNEKN